MASKADTIGRNGAAVPPPAAAPAPIDPVQTVADVSAAIVATRTTELVAALEANTQMLAALTAQLVALRTEIAPGLKKLATVNVPRWMR